MGTISQNYDILNIQKPNIKDIFVFFFHLCFHIHLTPSCPLWVPSVRDDMNPVPGHPNHNPDGILRGMGVSFVLDSVGNGGFPFLGFRTEL